MEEALASWCRLHWFKPSPPQLENDKLIPQIQREERARERLGKYTARWLVREEGIIGREAVRV